MDDVNVKRLLKFPPNRLGYVSDYVEPVSGSLEEEHIKEMFLSDNELKAIPIESDGGVSGLISRESCLHPEHRKLSFKQRLAADLTLPKVPILDAMDSMGTAVQKLMESGFQGEFLVYHASRYVGIASVRDVFAHAAKLQSEDLEQAKKVQEGFMYISEVQDPRIKLHWFNQMAHEVGGDFIQWRQINEDAWLLGVFDLAGKGVSAALSTSLISAYFTTLELTGVLKTERQPRIIYMLHQLMQKTLIEDSFVACAFIFFDLKEPAIRMYNCGLGPIFAWLTTEDGTLKHVKVDPNLPPLGFDGFPDDKLVPAKLKWVPGIKLFVGTDGFPDMKNPEGRQFSEEKVSEFILSRGTETGAELLRDCKDVISSWIGQAPQADDVTLAIVEWPK